MPEIDPYDEVTPFEVHVTAHDKKVSVGVDKHKDQTMGVFSTDNTADKTTKTVVVPDGEIEK